MPEGDTIFRAARALDRVLRGAVVERFESVYPALTRVDDDRRIAGRTIESVESIGKHLLIRFSGDLVLRTHMRMNGSWHLYRPGERWHAPRVDMRIVIATERAIAVAFNVPVAEFLTTRELARHKQLKALGPDLLGADVDAGEVARRVREHPQEPIGDVLLNQRVMAGVGNVLKSESLFVAGVEPFTLVADLPDDAVRRIVAEARRLLQLNVAPPSPTSAWRGGRRTTNSMDPAAKLWVYGRGGRPCRRCGSPIRAAKTGPDARLTYWCPSCQRR